MGEMRLRAAVRDNAKRDDGARVFRMGLCFGYWPCLRAPFVQVGIGLKTLDVWFGLPSYKP